MGNPSILDELRPALRSSIAALAEDLLGPPNTQNGRELRWGAKGSFRVIVSGSRQGACCDFEAGWKGDPLALIMRERRTDFLGAVEYGCQFAGIAFDGKGKQEDPTEWAARDAERERKRAEANLEQKADEAKRIAYARHLWNASSPIDGTVAWEYLEITRAIPRPATGWPDATVRYHAGTASLILAGTDAVGDVRFVQRIALSIDARKIDGTSKITTGVMAGAFVRLPGPTDGPLLLAEGPETALSVWSAGYETWASVGSITRHTPPVGRKVVVCRDDDRLQSQADQALKRSMSAWLAADINAVIATPWNVRREDKSDFNDVIQVDGVDAVKRRIQIALEPPHDRISRLTIEAGRMALSTAIDGFYSQLPRADATLVHAVKIDVGAGKSEISLQNIASKIRQMRRDGDKCVCVVAIPTHALGDQQMTRFLAMFNAKGISAGVWRSREAYADGEPMCFDRGAVKDANEALADVQTSVCQRKMPDGKVRECEHFAECRFQKQRQAKPDVIFVPHEIIYGQKPAGVGKPAFLVVDESSWADGLMGCDDRLWLLLDTLISENATVPDSPLSTGQLESSRRALYNALTEILRSVGELNPNQDIRLPAVRSILLSHGLCAETANECYALEWKRKTEAEIYPGMPPKSRKEAVAAVVHNQIVRKLGILWKSVAHLLADNGPEKSGRIGVGLAKHKNGVAPAVFMKGRRDIHDDWQIPTLIIDATLQPDLVRHFWPTMKLTADIRLQTPHQHVTQVIDRSYSKSQLGKASGLRDVHAIICREARRYKGRGPSGRPAGD